MQLSDNINNIAEPIISQEILKIIVYIVIRSTVSTYFFIYISTLASFHIVPVQEYTQLQMPKRTSASYIKKCQGCQMTRFQFNCRSLTDMYAEPLLCLIICYLKVSLIVIIIIQYFYNLLHSHLNTLTLPYPSPFPFYSHIIMIYPRSRATLLLYHNTLYPNSCSSFNCFTFTD